MSQYTYYGCEYIDDGAYGYPRVRKEPWRLNHPDAMEFRLDFALSLANKNHLRKIKKTDIDIINNLAYDIAINGLREPGIILYDSVCMFVIKEGHHRLCALELVIPKVTHMPFYVRQSHGKIKVPGRDLLPQLLQKMIES